MVRIRGPAQPRCQAQLAAGVVGVSDAAPAKGIARATTPRLNVLRRFDRVGQSVSKIDRASPMSSAALRRNFAHRKRAPGLDTV
jgi:hypothetical protein